MRAFLEEIQATIDAGIYSTALASAFVVPDACGAVEYPDERKNGIRFARWYDAYVGPYVARPALGMNGEVIDPGFTFDGSVVWKLRNGMMHETALELSQYGFDRVLFNPPNRQRIVIHMGRMKNVGSGANSALNLDLATFCGDVISGARKWLDGAERDPAKSDRLERLIQLRPNGHAPFIVGLPVVS